jgi:hypothetical protein
MTYDEIIQKHPHLKNDMESILEWFSTSFHNRNMLIFEEKSYSIKEFKSQIKEMSKTLKQFPNDLKRVKKIHNILKNNGLPYHIFIDSEKFIMEGRCRIVSQYLSKRNQIDVIRVKSPDNPLNEIKFTNIRNINFTSSGENYTYSFDINDSKYVVNFENIEKITSIKNSWSVSFRFDVNVGGSSSTNSVDDIIKLLTTNPYSNTGLGNEYKVYSHVISAILEFIKTKSPNFIYFDARDKKRARVYRKIASKLMSTLTGYSMHSGSVINNIYSFVIVKNN